MDNSEFAEAISLGSTTGHPAPTKIQAVRLISNIPTPVPGGFGETRQSNDLDEGGGRRTA